MVAGRYNEVIDIFKPTEEINEYGEREETLKHIFRTRAGIDHNSGTRANENDEIVYSYAKTFTVRSYTPITEKCIIEFDKKRWRVVTIDRRREYNDIVVSTELVNE